MENITSSEGIINLFVAVKRRELAAMMLTSAGRKEVRYYLQGVCFDIETSGKIKLVSTDGSRLTVLQLDQITDTGKRQIIVPCEVIAKLKLPKSFKNSKTNNELIVFNFAITPEYERICGNGKKQIFQESVKIEIVDGDVSMSTVNIDAKYPDYNRVINLDFEVKPCNYNAEYLIDAQIASQFINNEKYGYGSLYQNGTSCAIYRVNEKCLIGIMPMRSKRMRSKSDDENRFIHAWE